MSETNRVHRGRSGGLVLGDSVAEGHAGRVPTIAVGNIYEADHVSSIVAAGRADLCAIARPHLANPSWTLQAAAEQQYEAHWWPPQYLSGKCHLKRNLQRAALLAAAV